jgi:fructose-bisphosphate aldolase class II
MPVATPEVYGEMLDRAKSGAFAYPAINVTSSQTLNAALRGFAEAGSDGIVQVSIRRRRPPRRRGGLRTRP